MEPTEQQLKELYIQGFIITGQFKCFIRLIEMMPNGNLAIVYSPRNFLEGRDTLFIRPDGSRRYV